MLEMLDYTIHIGSTLTFLYFYLYLYSAYAAHFIYIYIRFIVFDICQVYAYTYLTDINNKTIDSNILTIRNMKNTKQTDS